MHDGTVDAGGRMTTWPELDGLDADVMDDVMSTEGWAPAYDDGAPAGSYRWSSHDEQWDIDVDNYGDTVVVTAWRNFGGSICEEHGAFTSFYSAMRFARSIRLRIIDLQIADVSGGRS